MDDRRKSQRADDMIKTVHVIKKLESIQDPNEIVRFPQCIGCYLCAKTSNVTSASRCSFSLSAMCRNTSFVSFRWNPQEPLSDQSWWKVIHEHKSRQQRRPRKNLSQVQKALKTLRVEIWVKYHRLIKSRFAKWKTFFCISYSRVCQTVFCSPEPGKSKLVGRKIRPFLKLMSICCVIRLHEWHL